MRRNFCINGIKLENVRSYKYLGFLITPSGEINSGLKDLRDRALKAFMKLKSDMGTSFSQYILTTLTLVDTMVKPIILYNSDFWGSLKLPIGNPVENLDMFICKSILGVQKCTSNIGVLLELGRVPLQFSAVKNAVKNWERIRKGKANKLVLASYKDANDENSLWILSIRQVLEQNGMLSLFLNEYENKLYFIHKKLFQTLSDQFHQTAFASIKDENSKLRTYSIFKSEIGLEDYLLNIKDYQGRKELTKLSLSNHRLMIETGRHKKIPKEMRFCPFCPNIVEDELHFLLQCPTYFTMRNTVLDIMTEGNPLLPFYSPKEKSTL